MTDNKYYTPNLEDFHVGFEYEWKCDSIQTDWTKSLCNTYMSPLKTGNIRINNYRVKYLDEQDFLDLGFIKAETDSLGYIYFTKSSYTITYYPPTIFIEIDNDESPFQKFIGTIKNKSELIKLLTQLGL